MMRKTLLLAVLLLCGVVHAQQVEVSFTEDFRSYRPQASPIGWDGPFRTAADPTDPNNVVFGTTGAHPNGAFTTLITSQFGARFEYRGRLLRTHAEARLGIAFHSARPERDAYYLIWLSETGGGKRRSVRSEASTLTMRLAGFGGAAPSGMLDSGVTPDANRWYDFLVETDEFRNATHLRAKFWPSGTPEPQEWHIEATDTSIWRHNAGRIGLWSSIRGDAWFDDLSAQSWRADQAPPEIRFFDADTQSELNPSKLALFKKPARIEVRVTGADGASVKLDGADYNGGPIAADGTHELTAEAGFVSATLRLLVDQTPPVIALLANGNELAPGHVFDRDVTLDARTTDVSRVTVTSTIGTLPMPVAEEAAHTITVTAVDQVGWESTATASFTVDKTAPLVTILGNGLPFLGGHTFNQDVTLTWTATDATLADVSATLDGNPIQSGAVVSAAAAHAVVVTATDRAGHSTRAARNFILRKEAAEVRLLANGAPLLEKTYGTAVTLTAEIIDPTPTTYTALLDGQPYTLGNAIPLEGLHTFTITVKNGAELETTVGPVTFTVDTTQPVVELSESGTPFGDGMKFNRNVLPQLAARDNLTATPEVTLFVDGREYTIGASIVEERAEHTISATATDDAGHVATIGPFRFMLDKTRPVVTIVSPAEPDALFAKPVLVEVEVQDLTPTDVTATIGGQVVDITQPIALNGTHQLSVVATDAVGWQSEPATIGFTIDTLAPQIRFTDPAADSDVSAATIDVTGFADDAVSITINGRPATIDEVNKTFAVHDLPLAEGRNELVAVAVDRAGNSSSTPLALHLDTRAPEVAITSPEPDACLDATSVEVRGTVSDRAVAKVTVNGITATVANGVFIASVPFPNEGKFTIEVEATDAAGHAAAINVPITIDRTAPLVEITENAGAFTATLLNRAIALFAGVTEPNAQSVALTLNGQPYSAGALISAERIHELKVTATDCAGHSSSKSVSFEIDRTPPSILTFAPQSGSSAGAKPQISGTTSPDAVTIRVEPGGATHNVANAAFSIDAPLVNGANELRFVVTDRAGNSAEQLYRLTLDLTTPAVEIVESGAPIPPNAVFGRDVTPVIRATERDATIDAKLNGNPFVSGTAVTAAGAYTLTATATDAAGHTSPPATAAFTIDRTGPAIDITSPADGARVDLDRVEVRGTVSGDDLQAVSINGVPATIAAGTFVASVPVDFGPNLIMATAIDRAGNAAADQVDVTRGSGPLGIFLTAPYDGMVTNRPTTVVSGQLLTAAPDAKVTINGVEVAVDPSGFFRKTDFTLSEGENVITARVVSGGGESNQTAVRVTADLTPPRLRVLESGQPLAEGARFASAAHITVETSEGTAELLVDSDLATTPVTIDEDGGHTIVATARDAAGNEARVERTIFIGVAGAAGCRIENLDPANGAVVTKNTVTISGRCGGAPGVKVNGTPAVVSNGSFCATIELPAEGDNAVTITCTDESGNPTGDPQTLVVRRATSDPSIAFSAPGEGSVSVTETITVTGTASNAVAVEVNGAPATFTNGNWSAASVRLSAGLNVIVARARNAAGRTTAVSRRVLYLKDAPSVTISSPSSTLITGTNRIDVSGGWSNIDPATLTVNGNAATVRTLSDTTGTYAAPEVALLAGDNTITVSARDAAGRIVTATTVVTVTAGHPTITVAEPADNAFFGAGSAETFTVRGTFTAVAGSTVEVSGEAAVIDGTSFTATVRHAAGRLTPVLARVTTPEGNTGVDFVQVTRLAARPKVLEHFPAVNAIEVDAGAMPLVLFSQPMDLATTAAAFRLENAAGSPVSGTIRLDRDVLTFAPAALLAPGERYTIRVADTAKSIAGDALESALAAGFTVASSAGAIAPTLAPIPAGCAQLAAISGTAPPNARLRIDLGTLTFSTTANAGGAWVYQLPVGGYSGYQVVRVRIAGSDGSLSPAAESCFLVDCAGPQVVSANYDRAANRVTINFSKDLNPSTVTNSSIVLRLADNRVVGGTLAVNGKTVTVTPSEDLTQKTFTLDVTTAIEDTGGTRLSFPYAQTFAYDSDAPPAAGDGSGFMSGEVFDAETGRPLAGAAVFIDVTPAPIVTDARGRYAAQLPEGAHTLRVSATGYTTVWRQIVIPPGAGVIPIDIRLTPTAATPARGPAVQAVVDSTAVDAQSLPGLLPLGWSPLAAAVARTSGQLEFPVPAAEVTAAAQTLTAVRYHDDRDEWRVLIAAANIVDGKIAIPVDEPGAYALVYPDQAPGLARPPTPTAGAVLTGVADVCAQQPSNPATPQPCPPLEAHSFVLDPPLVLPTGRTVATLEIKGSAPHNFPSGTAVQAYIDEELRLADGSRVTDPPFTTDLLLYRNLAGTLGVAEFKLGPSPRAAQVILDIGFNHIRILPYPGRLDRGTLVGPEGGRVPGDGRVTVEIPAGATTEAMRATSATIDDFSSFGAIPGFTIAGGFTLTLQLARAVTPDEGFTRAVPELLQGARATFPNAGAGQFILVEVLDGPRFPLAAQIESIAGGRVTTKTIDRAVLPVDGVVREGRYLLLKADAPIAFATGILRDPGGLYLRDARISSPPLGVIDVTRVSGTYALAVPAAPAAPFRLIPFTPATGEGAAYTHPTAPAANAVVRVDLTMQQQPPRLVSTEPASGAKEVALTAFVKAHFDADLDPASIGPSSITVVDADTRAAVVADVLLENPRTVLWRPRGGENRLAPNRDYAVSISAGIRGANGAPSGRAHSFRFSTVTQITSGDIHPEKIRITIPDANGRSRVIGAPGALPSEPDPSKRYIALVTRRGVDFLTPFQATAAADGSFTIDIGETVALTDLIDLQVLNSARAVAAIIPLTPFMTDDRRGFIAPVDRDVTFHGDLATITVKAGSFDQPTLVTTSPVAREEFTSVPNFENELTFHAGLAITFDGMAKKPLEVDIPVPAGTVTDGKSFFLGRLGDSVRGPRIEIDDTLIVSGGHFTTREPAGSGLRIGANSVFTGRRVKDYLMRITWGAGRWSVIDFKQPVGFVAAAGIEATHDIFWSAFQSLYCSTMYLVSSLGRAVFPVIPGAAFTVEGVDTGTGLTSFRSAYDGLAPPAAGSFVEVSSPVPNPTGPYPVFARPMYVQLADLHARDAVQVPVRGLSVVLPSGSGDAVVTRTGAAPAKLAVRNVRTGTFSSLLDESPRTIAAATGDRILVYGSTENVDPASRLELVFNEPVAANESTAGDFIVLEQKNGTSWVPVPVDYELDSGNRRVWIVLRGELQRGGEYRVMIKGSLADVAPEPLTVGTDIELPFTVRKPHGDLLGGPFSLPDGTVRDMALDGNLLFVSATEGDLLAYDVSNPAALATKPPIARASRTSAEENPNPTDIPGETWAVVVDHHGRIWTTAQTDRHGVVRSYRVEDFAKAPHPNGTPIRPVKQVAATIVSWRPGANANMPFGSTWAIQSDRPEAIPRRIHVATQDQSFKAVGGADALEGFEDNTLGAIATAAGTAGEFKVWNITIPRTPDADLEGKHLRSQRVTVRNETAQLRWSADILEPDSAATITGVLARPGDRLSIMRNVGTYAVVSLLGYGIGFYDLNAFEHNRRLPALPGDDQHAEQLGLTDARRTNFLGQPLPVCDESVQVGGTPCAPHALTFTTDAVAVPRSHGFDLFALETRKGLLNVSIEPEIGEMETGAYDAPKREEALAFTGSFLSGGEWVFNDHPRLVKIRKRFKEAGRSLNARFTGIATFQRNGRNFALVAGYHFGILVVDLDGDATSSDLTLGSLADVIWIPAGAYGVRHISGTHYATAVDGEGRSMLIDLSRIDERSEVLPIPLSCPMPCDTLMFPTVTKATAAGADPDSPLRFGTDDPRIIWKSAPDLDNLYGTLAPVADPDTGFIFSGDLLEQTVHVLSGLDPRMIVKARVGGGPLQPVTSVVPLGLEPPAGNHGSHLGAFRIEVALPGSLAESLGSGEMKVSIESEILPGVKANNPPPDWPVPHKDVPLRRVVTSTDPALRFQKGWNYFTSPWIVALADPRASEKYTWAAGADKAADGCYACDRPTELQNDPGVIEILSAGRAFVFRPDTALFGDSPYAYLAQQGRLAARISTTPVDTVRPKKIEIAPHNPPVAVGAMQETYYVHSGEMETGHIDLIARGRAGVDAVVDRNYRSRTIGWTPFGEGWDSRLFQRIRQLPTGDVEYRDGVGNVWLFKKGATAAYTPPPGVYLRLQSTDTGWRVIDPLWHITIFDRWGRMIGFADRFAHVQNTSRGNRIQYHYDSLGRLSQIIDPVGRISTLAYWEEGAGGFTGMVKSFKDWRQREVLFDYDANARLTKVRLPEVTAESSLDDASDYTFTGDNRPRIEYDYAPGGASFSDTVELRPNLISIKDPVQALAGGGPRVQFEYDAGHRDQVKTETSSTIQECGTGSCGRVAFTYPSGSAKIVDLLGQERTYELTDPASHDKRRHVAKLTEHQVPVDNRNTGDLNLLERAPVAPSFTLTDLVTAFQYDAEGEVANIDHPNGLDQRFFYEPVLAPARQNLKKIEEWAHGHTLISSYEYFTALKARNIARSVGRRDTATPDVPEAVRTLPVPFDDESGADPKTKITDHGTEVTTQYDEYGRPTMVSRTAPGAEGGAATQETRYYDSGAQVMLGRPSDILAGSSDNGTKLHIDYAPAGGRGEQITVIDPIRHTTTVEVRDAYDRVISRTITGSESEVLSSEKFAYDAEGRLRLHIRKQTGVAGGEVRTTFLYDAAGRLIETAMNNAQVEGAAATVKTKTVHNLGSRTTIEYAPYTTATGLNTSTQTDRLGRPERVVRNAGGDELQQLFGYDQAGNAVFITDGVRHSVLHRFDGFSRPIFTLRADGTRARSKWDAWGQLADREELSGIPEPGASPQRIAHADYLYSPHGWQYGANETIVSNTRRSTQKGFAEDGRTEVTRIGKSTTLFPDIDPGATRRTWRVGRDQAGRVDSQAFGEGSFNVFTSVFSRSTVTAFSGGMPQTVRQEEPLAPIAPAQYVTSTFTDGLGRVTRLHEAAGSYVSTTTYDEAGNPTLVHPAGYPQAWSQKYDSRGLVVETNAPEGTTVRRHYDALGNPLRYIDEDSQTTSYEVDGHGRVRKTTYEDETTEEILYETGTGQIAAVKDRANVWRSFFYDAGGRVVEERLGEPRDLEPATAPSGTPHLRYAYDAGGRLSEIRSKDAALQYDGYDLLGRPLTTRALRFKESTGFAATPQLLDAHTQQHHWSLFDGERERWRMPAAGTSVPEEEAASQWRSWIAEERDAGGNITVQRAIGAAGAVETLNTATGRGVGRIAGRNRFFGADGHLHEGFGYADGDVPGAAPGPVSGLLGRFRTELDLVAASGSEVQRDAARRAAIVSDLALQPRRSDFGYDDRGRLQASSLLRTEDSGSFVSEGLIHSDFRQSRTVVTAPQDLAELGSAAASVLPSSWSATKNDVHQLSTRQLSNESAERVYEFAAGRRTGDGQWTAQYDEEGRLVGLTRGQSIIRYTYDPRGRIVGRSAVKIDGDPLPAETTWVWDPFADRLLAIYEAGKSIGAASADAGLVRQYVHGDQGYDDPVEISVRQPDGAVVRYLPLIDYAGTGSVQAVINGTSGKMAERILFADAYGGDPRYLHGPVVDKISVELRKDPQGNVAEAKLRVRLSEAVDEATLAAGIRVAALTAGNVVVSTAAAATPTLETPHTILLTLGAVAWTTLTTAPDAAQLEIAVTRDLRATLWDGPVMPLPDWMLDAPGRASTATHPVIQREPLAALAELAAATGAGGTRSRTLLEVRNLYLVAGRESRTGLGAGFKAAPFVEGATGWAYFRARWYDPATGTFLNPDNLGYRDSSNLYAFCADDPVNCSDPDGLARRTANGGVNFLGDWGDDHNGGIGFWAITRNTIGNTISTALLLDAFADATYVAGDSTRSGGERTWAAGKAVGIAAWNVVGGQIVGTGSKAAMRVPWVRTFVGKVAASRMGRVLGAEVNPLRWFDDIGEAAGRGLNEGVAEATQQLAPNITMSMLQRQRVMSNITASRGSRSTSRFGNYADVESLWRARNAQAGPPYGGQDIWAIGILKKGHVVYGGVPGQSAFYTDLTSVLASGFDRTVLSQSMQVAKHPALGYRPTVRAYRLKRNLRIPIGYAHANPHLGAGGALQYYIDDYAQVLEPVYDFPLTN
jgi:RHS repeat-associated protein